MTVKRSALGQWLTTGGGGRDTAPPPPHTKGLREGRRVGGQVIDWLVGWAGRRAVVRAGGWPCARVVG